MSVESLVLSNERVLNRMALMEQNRLMEAIKNFIFAVCCIVALIILGLNPIGFVGISIIQLMLVFLAVYFGLKGLYVILSQEKRELIVTTHRIFFQTSNRVQVIDIQDYHYEFFESTEVHFHTTQLQKIAKQVVMIIFGIVIIIYGVVIDMFVLEISTIGGFLVLVGAVSLVFVLFTRTAIEFSIVLTSGEKILLQLNPREHGTEEIYAVFTNIIQNSRRFIENR